MNQELSRQRQRIIYLFEMPKREPGVSDEYLGHWARYLCITCAGFLENGLKEIFKDYLRARCAPPILKFGSKTLERVTNANAQKFVDLCGQFNDEWRIDLETFLADNGRKEAMDSIISIRHNLAHGGDYGVSLVRMRDYFDKSVQVIEFLESKVNS